MVTPRITKHSELKKLPRGNVEFLCGGIKHSRNSNNINWYFESTGVIKRELSKIFLADSDCSIVWEMIARNGNSF